MGRNGCRHVPLSGRRIEGNKRAQDLDASLVLRRQTARLNQRGSVANEMREVK